MVCTGLYKVCITKLVQLRPCRCLFRFENFDKSFIWLYLRSGPVPRPRLRVESACSLPLTTTISLLSSALHPRISPPFSPVAISSTVLVTAIDGAQQAGVPQPPARPDKSNAQHPARRLRLHPHSCLAGAARFRGSYPLGQRMKAQVCT